MRTALTAIRAFAWLHRAKVPWGIDFSEEQRRASGEKFERTRLILRSGAKRERSHKIDPRENVRTHGEGETSRKENGHGSKGKKGKRSAGEEFCSEW